jgi:hypothetical protein
MRSTISFTSTSNLVVPFVEEVLHPLRKISPLIMIMPQEKSEVCYVSIVIDTSSVDTVRGLMHSYFGRMSISIVNTTQDG